MKTTISAISLFLLNGAVLLVPLVESTTCTQGSTDAWAVSLLIYAPLIIILSIISLSGLAAARHLFWYTLPQLIILPYALYIAAKYTAGVGFQNNHPCTILMHTLTRYGYNTGGLSS